MIVVYNKNINSCKNHIEIILKIYEVFLKWSPAPSPSLAQTKLPRGKTNQKNNNIVFFFFYFRNYKLIQKWSPAPSLFPAR